MRIKRISMYMGTLDYLVLSRARASGSRLNLEDTIIAIETDAGVTGYGEACPLAPTYLPMLPAATRAGIAQIAPLLIGRDPRGIASLYAAMDGCVIGFSGCQVGARHGVLGFVGKECGGCLSTPCLAVVNLNRCWSMSVCRTIRRRRWLILFVGTAPMVIGAFK